jgi:TetR/AcrR family transcriptional repressor of nem operon
MARTVKEQERAARVNAILDAAQALIQRKGYERMTIQDLLETLQISKGAFYHYFDSKLALLEALVERMVEEVTAALGPLAEDSRLSAPHKLEAIFRLAAGFKSERVDLMVELARVWYADDDAVIRDKLERASLDLMRSLLHPIIAQGVSEGTMATDYPDVAAVMVTDLSRGMSQELMRQLMAWDERDGRQRAQRCIAAYTDAIEGLLGMERGTLHLVEVTALEAWALALSARPGAASKR